MLFSISLLAVVITSFFSMPTIGYIDYKVIVCLFELMIIVKAYEEYSLLNYISVSILKSCKNQRVLTQALCLISFVFSMFLTNDVALLTIIPIMLIISKKSDFNIVLPSIMITLAANLGSAVTPMGNPQNLYIFSFYKLTAKSFLGFSLPIFIISFILLLLVSFVIKPKQIHCVISPIQIKEKKKIVLFSILFALVILSVFGIVHYLISFPIVVITTLILNKTLVNKVDYRLLGTFVCFFIAIGNISNIPILESNLSSFTKTSSSVYLSSIMLSQVISNVPTAILLAPFTNNSYALFCGVNIGGLGTPVASLASLIAYKLFVTEYPQMKREYLVRFTVLNFLFLLILGSIFYLSNM